MADTKTSDLPAATDLVGATFPIVQGGGNKKAGIALFTPTALGAAPTSRNVSTQHSLTGGGDMTADRTLSLVNDEASPGEGKYYGTDAEGNKGYHALPGGPGSIAAGDITDVGETGVLAIQAETEADLREAAGLEIDGDLGENEFYVGDDSGDAVPKTPAEVRTILGVDNQFSIALPWESTEEAADGTYVLALSMRRAFTINSLTHIRNTRSAGVLAVKINTTDVTSLTSIAPGNTKTTTNATAANTGSSGDSISLVISGTSDITGLVAQINGTWG